MFGFNVRILYGRISNVVVKAGTEYGGVAEANVSCFDLNTFDTLC